MISFSSAKSGDICGALCYKLTLCGAGVSNSERTSLINTYFNTEPFSNFITAIDAGYTVTTNFFVNSTTAHNIVVVGYQSDGDLIYMNPTSGSLEEAPASNFNINDAITITSVK